MFGPLRGSFWSMSIPMSTWQFWTLAQGLSQGHIALQDLANCALPDQGCTQHSHESAMLICVQERQAKAYQASPKEPTCTIAPQ